MLKIPLSLFLGAVCHAPRGHRISVARRLLSSSSDDAATPAAEVCEFKSPNDYGRNYARLSALLGCDGKIPPLVKSNFSIPCCIGRCTILVRSVAVIIVF